MGKRTELIKYIQQSNDGEVEKIYQAVFQQPEKKVIGKLEGIWKNVGFENLDLEKEIKKLRKEADEDLRNRSKKWNS